MIKELFKIITGKTLYYPGCLTKETKKEFSNYKEILKRLKIKHILIKEEKCCGLELINAGYKKQAKKQAKENHELFKKMKIKKIITNCPHSYHAFKTLYPKLITNWDIEVEHITQTIYKALKKNKIELKNSEKENVSYHDPCYLGRYENEYETPRKIIELLGGEITEPIKTKENAFCCGAGGNLRESYKETSKKIAKLRLTHFSKDVKKIITPCVLCYSSLNPYDERVIEISDYVLGRLKGLTN